MIQQEPILIIQNSQIKPASTNVFYKQLKNNKNLTTPYNQVFSGISSDQKPIRSQSFINGSLFQNQVQIPNFNSSQVIENEKINLGENFSPKDAQDIYSSQANKVTKQKTGSNTPQIIKTQKNNLHTKTNGKGINFSVAL